jgi:hypothetical protein
MTVTVQLSLGGAPVPEAFYCSIESLEVEESSDGPAPARPPLRTPPRPPPSCIHSAQTAAPSGSPAPGRSSPWPKGTTSTPWLR